MSTPIGEWTLPTTHYDILGLPQPPLLLRQPDMKAAYHRALLRHHPDKSGSSTPSTYGTISVQSSTLPVHVTSPRTVPTYTVDQITLAYKVLSDPRARAEYDRSLHLPGGNNGAGANRAVKDGDQVFRTGLEVFDLDDMQIGVGSEGAEFWYRGCRCGDTKGFLVSGEDLENETESGEIMVGCQGCSLWAKILFAVDEDGQDGCEEEKDCTEGNS